MALDVKDQKTKKLDAYSDVVSKASLNDVNLFDLEFKVKPEFYSESEKKKLGYEIENVSSQFDVDVGVAASFISLAVVGTVGRKKVLVCKAAYSVIYDNLKGCEPEAVEAFLRRVAQFACYPYFRSLFASLDWAAGLRLPPLPVHKEPVRNPGKAENAKLPPVLE